MAIRVRRIYGAIHTTGTNIANLLISKSCRILSVQFAIQGVAAAAADAWGTIEISRSNAYQLSTNDTQQQVAACSWNAPVASVAIAHNAETLVGGVDVAAGDYLYLHCFRSGTQPTNLYVHATIFCQE